jgi:hypothetical protein
MLTQVATVKARLKLDESDVKDDVLLDQLIKLVSGRFEKEANRVFGYSAEATEEFQGDQIEIIPARLPIVSVASFALKTTEAVGWEAAVADYVIRKSCVVTLASPLGTGKQLGRVTYAGGFILPGSDSVNGVSGLPDDVEQSCIDQVVYFYQNKDRLGLTSISGGQGSIQQLSSLDLLPSVAQVLSRYERWLN